MDWLEVAGSVGTTLGYVMSTATGELLGTLAGDAVEVTISFPSLYSLNATMFKIMVVELSRVSVRTEPYGHSLISSESLSSTIRPFSCSGNFQRLQAVATAHLSDGTEISGAQLQNLGAVFSSGNESVFTLSGLNNPEYLCSTAGVVHFSLDSDAKYAESSTRCIRSINDTRQELQKVA